ncbi:hypothetical protein QTS76_36675 [Micromonospora sp. b486]|nr:hypothetical protein [Micromonospora sp. b486]MDM4784600.1 hypothetical protein [Micromonospora sp. b486]
MLARERDFGARLAGVLHAGVDVLSPYHTFAGAFFKTAAEPTSPLSPFSAESSAPRGHVDRAVPRGAHRLTVKLDDELREALPSCSGSATWVWCSTGCTTARRGRSRPAAHRRVVPLVDRLVGLSRLRALRPVTGRRSP